MKLKPIKFVENAFNLNDWFVIVAILITYAVVWLLPRRIPVFTSCLIMMYSIAMASIFDNSIGYMAFDFYDIMDGPDYTIMDLVVYLLYAPFGYFFIYGYECLRVRGVGTVFYILLHTIFAVAFEWVCLQFGVFHHKNGYGIHYSFLVYLFVQTGAVFFYRYIK